MFKPYPVELKSHETKGWAELQVARLTPFESGGNYWVTSHQGLHLWMAPQAFTGLPASACQQVLKDGEHHVVLRQKHFKQTWQNGVMQSCQPYPDVGPEDSATVEARIDGFWAVPRHLDAIAKKPYFWLSVSLTILAWVFIWFVVSYSSITLSQKDLQSEITTLNDTLSDKLAQQTAMRDIVQGITGLNVWKSEHGSLPEDLSLVIGKLSSSESLLVNTIQWQNKNFLLEFSSQNADISQLVAELESLQQIDQVNIRPHNKPSTWVLEASVR